MCFSESGISAGAAVSCSNNSQDSGGEGNPALTSTPSANGVNSSAGLTDTPSPLSSGSADTMQTYPALGGQNAASFGMQNAGFYGQSQSAYGMSYPMADGELAKNITLTCLVFQLMKYK